TVIYPAAIAEAAAAEPAHVDASPPRAAAPVEARFARVYALVNAYRVRGHLEARLDPLDHLPRDPHPDLDPATWGFSDRDMSRVVPSGGLFGVPGNQAPLGEIIRRLRT